MDETQISRGRQQGSPAGHRSLSARVSRLGRSGDRLNVDTTVSTTTQHFDQIMSEKWSILVSYSLLIRSPNRLSAWSSLSATWLT